MRVNGLPVPAEGRMVDPQLDRVTVGGRLVEPARRRRYLLLNKPAGVLVTARDTAGRPTVFDLLDEEVRRGGRLFSAGRLDMASSGLLLITDDGDLAQLLTHPRHVVEKEYLAVVAGVPRERDLRRLREGIELEDGVTAPARAELVRTWPDGRAEVRMVIHEGRNRQVRRMLAAVGHPVRRLTRTGFGPVRLSRLREGSWRKLRPSELAALRRAAS